MPEVVPLLDLPHAEARARLGTGAPVYLLVNPVEYHGPHLPLHCDMLISTGFAKDVHQRLRAKRPEWEMLVAQNLEIGVDPVPGPGTRAVPYTVAREQVLSACRALAEMGAKRVALMTFHGSPLHNLALHAGVKLLESRGVRAVAPLNLALSEMLSLDGASFAEAFAGVPDPAERAKMIADLPHDFHGGFLETSLLLHYAPDSVSPRHVDLPPCPEVKPLPALMALSRAFGAVGARRLSLEIAFAAAGLAWYALRPFPGYTGSPHHASPAAGSVFARRFAERFAELADDVFEGRARSPAPIMAWLPALSLGGRLPQPGVPLDAISTFP